jgi:hypothetical protein
MLSRVSPSTTICRIGARLGSGDVGIESGLMMTLSRPSVPSPTATPSSAAAALIAGAWEFGKKLRSKVA